jgi:hypothetical protein
VRNRVLEVRVRAPPDGARMTNRSSHLRRASAISLALVGAALFTACVADPSGAPVEPADDDASIEDARVADAPATNAPPGEGDASAADTRTAGSDTGTSPSGHGGADSGAYDSGAQDTSLADSGAHDSGAHDTSVADSGAHDTSVADSGVADTHVADSGTADTHVADTGTADTHVADSGTADTSVADTSAPDPTNLVWRQANLTWFTSYPDPGSEECVQYNGCTWAGQFAATSGVQPLSWVQSHNIAAVHSKDFAKYELKTLRLKQGTKTIDVVVYDECADSDCSGCCTKNAGSLGYLIDLESYTADRFGVHSGVVDWACLDCGSTP